MAKKAQINWTLYFLLAVIFISGGLLAWHYDWLKFMPKFNSNPNLENPITTPPGECPKTSADMGKPCCRTLESGEMQAAVAAVYISASCKQCPIDTHFLQMAPEGGGNLYKICECNACSG